MSDPQGIAKWPGIQQIVSCQYTASHGITPSVAVLEIAPQYNDFQAEGDLVFDYNGKTITLKDCKVDSFSFERNSAGLVWRLSILDRRWKWNYGKLSGLYNVRKDNGDLQTAGNRNQSLVYDTEKKPEELAKLCLDAIGEKGYDLSDIPNDLRPSVDWDVEIPMQALANLCEELNCRIVLQLDNTVKIVVKGEGERLPELPSMMDDSGTIDPPNFVSQLTVMCGKVLYQHDFELEAVGYEMDGSLKLIDELSYKPSTGWTDIDIDTFNSITDKEKRELAQSCIFKVYRVKTPVTIKQFGTVNGLEQLGLTNNQVVTVSDYDSRGKLKPERLTRAIVWGNYYNRSGNYENTGTSNLPQVITKEQLKKVITSFSLDTEKRLVVFNEATYKLDGTIPNLKLKPGDLKLRCATAVREEKTRGWWRYQKSKGKGNPEKILKHDELILAYRSDGDNRKEIDKQADYYLKSEWEQLQSKEPQSRTYAGLVPIELDGAIQQVSYSVGLSGAITKASRSNDQDLGSPSYDEKRFYEKLRDKVKRTK